jgi:hypothetical protein
MNLAIWTKIASLLFSMWADIRSSQVPSKIHHGTSRVAQSSRTIVRFSISHPSSSPFYRVLPRWHPDFQQGLSRSCSRNGPSRHHHRYATGSAQGNSRGYNPGRLCHTRRPLTQEFIVRSLIRSKSMSCCQSLMKVRHSTPLGSQGRRHQAVEPSCG